MNPTLAPTMSPTASPTYCGKASKSWYYDDDYTSGKSGKSGSESGKSGKSGSESGKSGKSGSEESGKSSKSEDCSKGPRPSGKGGKSGSESGKSGKSGSEDRRRLHGSRGRGRSGGRISQAPEALNVRRRKIQGRD